jgi:chromosome segregation ATPase
MSEDQLDELDRSNQLIEETRAKLRTAHDQASKAERADKAGVLAKIEQDLKDLTDLQEELALDGLLGVASSLNALSDLLDHAITDIKHSIDNFLLADFKELLGDFDKLKEKVAALLTQTAGGEGGTEDT